MSSNRAHSPIFIFGPVIPTLTPRNSPLLLLRKKGGFRYYNNYPTFLICHLCLCRCLFNCPKAHSWRFGIWDAPVLKFCGSMFPTFYGAMEIQRPRIFLKLGQEFSHMLSLLIHILLKDLICFTFCTLKSQELVRGDLISFRKSFKYFHLFSLLFLFI